ncbi:hypothetical protein GGX14DRAFT_354292 [Mycena pura]|uniref:F-box domain-containing protein n=1 Tax=Mycena pura TaxID=153505 RepID=A0AAD6VUL2_9AGAR|nr:hypothetical protein GGX14DRAFT_354292 [Mycena pura]
MSAVQLASFPEELLERILADAVVAPPTPHPRAPWHHPQPDDTKAVRTRLAPLLVCRAFHRIALPLFYHTLVLHTPSQSHALLRTLRAQPGLARAVRTLVLVAPSPADADILHLLCRTERLLALDVTLPTASEGDTAPDAAFACALRSLRSLTDLVVRKGAGTYLSQPAARAALEALADAVSSCPSLETTTLSFPLSADPTLVPLVAALAAAPALHTLRTPLPAFWTLPLLTVSANPALAKICLGDLPASAPACKDKGRPLLGTSLFLAAARQHARLSELIRAGTAVLGWRGRAWTMGAGAYPPPPALQAGAKEREAPMFMGPGASSC